MPVCYDRIRDWLVYDGSADRPSAPKLWAEDKVVYERLVQLRALLFSKAYSIQDALLLMVKTYGISEATFYRDYRGLEYIFGDLGTHSKQFEQLRYKAIQEKILQMALEVKDTKAANAAMSNLIKLGGHDRDDVDPIDPDRLNPGMYALLLDTEVRDFIIGALQSRGSLDISKLMDGLAEDAEVVENETQDEQEDGNS